MGRSFYPATLGQCVHGLSDRLRPNPLECGELSRTQRAAILQPGQRCLLGPGRAVLAGVGLGIPAGLWAAVHRGRTIRQAWFTEAMTTRLNAEERRTLIAAIGLLERIVND